MPTKVTQTALIVDDQESIRKLVERILQRAGFETSIAVDGVDALKVAATIDHLDLLVTDLEMPNMNGTELARRLRSLEPDLPVLFLTGYSDRLFEERQLTWESEAFLDKPFTVTALLEAVALLSTGHTDLNWQEQKTDRRLSVVPVPA